MFTLLRRWWAILTMPKCPHLWRPALSEGKPAKYQELQRVYALVSHWHGEYDRMVAENEQLKASMEGN